MIFNTYCFSTATMVTRMRLSVTLCVYCLSCWVSTVVNLTSAVSGSWPCDNDSSNSAVSERRVVPKFKVSNAVLLRHFFFLKVESLRCLQTSGFDYPLTQHHVPGEQNSRSNNWVNHFKRNQWGLHGREYCRFCARPIFHYRRRRRHHHHHLHLHLKRPPFFLFASLISLLHNIWSYLFKIIIIVINNILLIKIITKTFP
jgi:hypothetical protein